MGATTGVSAQLPVRIIRREDKTNASSISNIKYI